MDPPEAAGRNAGDPAAEPSQRAPFEDHTEQAGIDFVHQLADGKLDNIMESDGAGGAILDYDADGWMDLYLVNSGPAPVLTDAVAGTPRWPNRLYRNRGEVDGSSLIQLLAA